MNFNRKIAYTLAAVIIGLALYASSLYSYNLFHSIAEMFSIAIALSVFVIAWNTRIFSPNSYLLFMGITFLYVAFVDLLHTLAYKDMGVFTGYDANLPTQLWIAGRYMQSISFLFASYFIGRKLKVLPVFITYSVVSLILLLSISQGLFPDAFIEGKGLTLFKIISEYVISLILAGAIIYLRKKKTYFEKPVLDLLIWSMIATIASEMAFTLYTEVYGLFNMLGHFFKIISFYLIYAAIVKTNLKTPYEAMAHEIAERKQTEEELLIKNYVFESAIVANSYADTRGIITKMNTAFLKLWGYNTKEEAAGHSVASFFVDEQDALPVLEALERAGEWEGEFLAKRADGSSFISRGYASVVRDKTGKQIGYYSANVDVTEERQNREALRENEERLRLALVATNQAWFEVNVQTGHISVSPQYARMIGYDPAEFHTNLQNWIENLHPDDRDAVLQEFHKCLATGQQGTIEYRRRMKSGEWKWIRSVVKIIEWDAEQKPLRMIGIHADITERRKAEEELQELNLTLEKRVTERTAELQESQLALMNIVDDLNNKTAELEQANIKLKDLDRLKSMFIASMSHELRTPLNSIIGFSSILHDEWIGPVNAEQKDNLSTILRSGKHLLNLINDVIDVSKIESGKIDVAYADFNVYDVISEAVELFKKDVQDKGIDLKVEAIHLAMHTDRRRLLQCVVNLISNAVKFTERGSVRVQARLVNSITTVNSEKESKKLFTNDWLF